MTLPSMFAGQWMFIDHLVRSGGLNLRRPIPLGTVDVPFEELADLDRAWVTYWSGDVQQSMDHTNPSKHAEWGQWTVQLNPSRIDAARELSAAATALDRIARTGSADIQILKQRYGVTHKLLLQLEQHGFIQAYLLDLDSNASPVESTVAEAQKASTPYRVYVAVTPYGRARTGGCVRADSTPGSTG